VSNAGVFGQSAGTYRKGRPGYPAALFDWIARNAPATDDCWDCATGSGQAAVSLAERFRHVLATDFSAEQIAEASPHGNISYSVASAEASGLGAESVDAITVATALHWFDFEAFWSEVRRVARPGALFTAWTYGLIETQDHALQRIYLDPLYALIDPFWAEGNRLAMSGYTAEAVAFPFKTLPFPDTPYRVEWTAEQLFAFTRSWSGCVRAIGEGGLGDAIDALETKAAAQLNGRTASLRLPLKGIAGYTA
jgi:SAM-dependent methyltransferase